ncbi:glutaredoxin domain-containing cysteine-rich protein 2 isoform X1 [Xiphophorus couchianus]|uniref:glutaredoxin domain-containing cysteine-rich protein 2 isoform X1 n=1 Tax=Xiphophorus couchianus TaxID=32473 RepID=UPI001015EA9D|nr:glutaredoxin domain-containing cysteine-rich protein 2 isoform X1 [Xiphophorus couchianus]XP_027888205.1 glutaredoxin domain-containing cysteine-rich protein 2 isoform X1 [Xiphophorus couchianus]XP_027888206.1 glutaredoxin domain-containing cysteine-rich protein 2 isoform X1 [Xiphophorus couchianus]XP_027888208.1 glutaredoxin domain-containing cysteine-rich protein 2 isoform X1 [Xiphophorus couchianus]XP_027888209.1 glutaredoxin domain-containing cysteine-rich protein 2 isoform X1 [Xiphophor
MVCSKSSAMEEFQRKLNQRYEGTKPRKVRFKLASSYSGRVLKHVYEDGQELESPEEKYPHSFIHRKIPPSHLEMEQFCSFEETNRDEQGLYPTTGLIAQRINVYRGLRNYKPAGGQTVETEGDSKSSVLDFGKIIIYTSNLRIIRAPPKKPEMMRQHSIPPVELEGCPKARDRESRKRAKALKAQEDLEKEENGIENEDTKETDSCQHCGGSGCAPCSLCHGSKLSMLANRFNESISDLRCQACYPDGLERCQSCSSK